MDSFMAFQSQGMRRFMHWWTNDQGSLIPLLCAFPTQTEQRCETWQGKCVWALARGGMGLIEAFPLLVAGEWDVWNKSFHLK